MRDILQPYDHMWFHWNALDRRDRRVRGPRGLCVHRSGKPKKILNQVGWIRPGLSETAKPRGTDHKDHLHGTNTMTATE
jgi:hypothetical protein